MDVKSFEKITEKGLSPTREKLELGVRGNENEERKMLNLAKCNRI